MKHLVFAAFLVLTTFGAHAEQLVLQSDEHKFIWPLPKGWEETQSLTKGQYAIKWQGDELMTIVLQVMKEDKATMADLLKAHESNPRFLFNGVLQRYPESKFISSSVVKLGSHDAIQSQCEYEVTNLDNKLRAFTCQFVAIWRGQVFSLAFECLPENRERGLEIMTKALAAFSFTEP